MGGLLLLISVDALSHQVSAPVVTSQFINLQHVDWNHQNIDTYCRIRNCSCNNNSDCLHKYICHHYDEGGKKGSNLSTSWSDELKNANLIPLSILFVLRWNIQQWVQTTRYRQSVTMISNDRSTMPSSADLHGITESTARGEQPVGGNSNR